MQQEVEVHTGGIPPSAYNIAAAIAAQNALNAGKTMDEAVAVARVAKEADENNAPATQQHPEAQPDAKKWREYCLCLCHVLHGRFAHLSTPRIEQIARLHSGQGIRSFTDWASDEE